VVLLVPCAGMMRHKVALCGDGHNLDQAWHHRVPLLRGFVTALVPTAHSTAHPSPVDQPDTPFTDTGASKPTISRKLLRTVVDKSKIVVKVNGDKVKVKSSGDDVDYVAQTGGLWQ
jgi:hypothetical protein